MRFVPTAVARCVVPLHLARCNLARRKATVDHPQSAALFVTLMNRSATTCTKACATPSGRCSTRPTRTARITSKLTEQPLSSQCDCMPWHNVQHKPQHAMAGQAACQIARANVAPYRNAKQQQFTNGCAFTYRSVSTRVRRLNRRLVPHWRFHCCKATDSPLLFL